MTPDAAPPTVAQVAVDIALPHLDRVFDYAVPPAWQSAAAPGVRVRVRFAGKLRDGFVLSLSDTSDAGAQLRPLERVVSPEVVLTPPVAALCRQVADHYCGTFSDVVRLAVPPRHATAEEAEPPVHPPPDAPAPPTVLPGYEGGTTFLQALRDGRPVRAAWAVVPTAGSAGDGLGGLVETAAATLASGRGAVLVVPDADALAALAARATRAFGAGAFVSLTAEAGPAARYRAFLAVVRGGVRLVLGTRNAVYAPVHDLGLLALWDDGNDSLSEPRAPYPHAREVAALRVGEERCALLIAGHGRTAETQALLERGWLAPIGLPPREVRRLAPVIRVAADRDAALDKDPDAHAARLPHDVFAAIRAGLASGPVLVHVPRAGYVAAVACQGCRTPARCPRCGQVLRGERGETGLVLDCGLCGALVGPWRCPDCGDTRLRAPRVGVTRTAEELGKAFPQVKIIQSWAGHRVDAVNEEPALVLATPGAEPAPSSGYAAAILLDTAVSLTRPELRAAEESLRRWLAVCALVRPAAEGGTVLAVGDLEARALQALVRLDPVGFAEREVAERRATGFPPAAKLVMIEGPAAVLAEYAEAATGVPDVESFGPHELGPDDAWRLTLRAPSASAHTLVSAVRVHSSVRSARKAEGAVRVRVDPQVIS